jgi:hypothetical protein
MKDDDLHVLLGFERYEQPRVPVVQQLSGIWMAATIIASILYCLNEIRMFLFPA